MSFSYTATESTTFTITHAKHMAAKVATDLKRMQRFYSKPTDASIAQYEEEVIAFLKAGYLGTVTYGFKRDDAWVEPTLRYTARDLAGLSANDDDPGRIRPGVDVSEASFYSFMTYSSAWNGLTADEQKAFENSLPFVRGNAAEPGIKGYLSEDLTYASGGRALNRACVRSYR